MLLNQCIETMAVVNRQIQNITYHNGRLNKTRKELWAFKDIWNLAEIKIPDLVTNVKHKLRITYSKEIETMQWSVYEPREVFKIKKVYTPKIDYNYKYADRQALTSLFEQREDADEILIIHNSMVSDSFYGNVALFDGEAWFTPNTPLLAGTQRAFLIQNGFIKAKRISESDLKHYTHIRIFNALIDWENAPTLEIGMVV